MNKFKEPEPLERPSLAHATDWRAFDEFVKWAERCGHYPALATARNFEQFARNTTKENES